MSGCVKVEHVRQKKCWNFTTRDENFGVNFYELKRNHARSLFPREDEIVTLEQNTNQEIEVIVDPMSVPCMQLLSPHV